jgi:hypothetical protein
MVRGEGVRGEGDACNLMDEEIVRPQCALYGSPSGAGGRTVMEESAYLKFVRIELHAFLKQARDVLRHDACAAVPHRHGHMTCV